MPREREGPAGGRAGGTGKGGGGGCAPQRAGGREAETARPPAAEGARPGDPSSQPRSGQTDGLRCVQQAPGHVQPELPEKTLQPLGECPPPERGGSPGAPGPPRAPLPGVPAPGARAPVAPGKRPRWRAGCVRSAREGSEVRKGLSPTPAQGRGRPGTVAHSVPVWGSLESPLLASSFHADPNPTTQPQGPASWRSSRGLDFGSVFWGDLCCPLPGSTSLFQGERHCCFSGDSGKGLAFVS